MWKCRVAASSGLLKIMVRNPGGTKRMCDAFEFKMSLPAIRDEVRLSPVSVQVTMGRFLFTRRGGKRHRDDIVIVSKME